MIIYGWWYTYPSEKYEFVKWDDDSQYMEKKTHVPSHQPDIHIYSGILEWNNPPFKGDSLNDSFLIRPRSPFFGVLPTVLPSNNSISPVGHI